MRAETISVQQFLAGLSNTAAMQRARPKRWRYSQKETPKRLETPPSESWFSAIVHRYTDPQGGTHDFIV